MKNLIKAIETERKSAIERFINEINQVNDISVFKSKYGYYSDLIPNGKDLSKMSIDMLRAYLITRKEKSVYKSIEREVKQIQTVFNAGELISVKISVEWKRSRMWGMNPTGECWATFKDGSGTNSVYVKSSSIGGCGYDKLSTAVAECLNQVNATLKPLYELKDKNATAKNNDILGYGSGYGILPYFEGGVGVSCYNPLFNKVGYEFKTVASGKTFDVYTISKLN